jgi:hypothetical protein
MERILFFREDHRELPQLIGCGKKLSFHRILIGFFKDFSAEAVEKLYSLGS